MKIFYTAGILSAFLALSSAQNRLPPNQPRSVYHHPEYISPHARERPQPHILETESSPSTQDVTIHYISRLNPLFPGQWRRQKPSTWTVKMRPSTDSAGDFSGFALLEDETVFRRAWIADGAESNNVKCFIGGSITPDGSNMFDAENPFKGNAKSRMLRCKLEGRGLRKIEELDDERLLRGTSSVDGYGNLLKGAGQRELPEASVARYRQKSRWW